MSEDGMERTESKRRQICDLLTEWILEVKGCVERESYHPSPDADHSDDVIEQGIKDLAKLRELRQQVEDV